MSPVTAKSQSKATFDPVIVKVGKTIIDTSSFSVGVTYVGGRREQGDPAALERAKELLKGTVIYQNQHIMNWGTGNPEPKPEVYDWADARVKDEFVKDYAELCKQVATGITSDYFNS